MVTLGAVLFLALLAATAGVAPETVLPVVERAPIAVVLNTPTGRAARTSRSEVIRIVDRLLKDHTDFFSQPVDEAVVRDCQGRLTCVALTTRRDYKRESLLDESGAPLPFSVHEARLEERGTRVASYLLMISNVAGSERGDRMSIILLDLTKALELHHEHPRRAGYQDEIEIAISENAVLASPPPALIKDESGAKAFIERAFERDFASPLARAEHWEPFGVVVVDLNVDGASIDLDGEAAGQADGRRIRLTGVAPGDRTLTFRRPGYQTKTARVSVRPRQTANVTTELMLDEVSGISARSIVMYAGLAVALAGGALAVYGLARHDGGVQSNCFADTSDCAEGRSFESFGYDPTRSDRADRVNPSGILVVPLGYSLFGAGATASASTFLFVEPDETPWLPVLIGVVVGALSYGISAAL